MNQRFSLIPHFQKHHGYILGPKERWQCAICVNKTLPACKMELHYQKSHSEFTEINSEALVVKASTPKVNKKPPKMSALKRVKKSKNFFPCTLCGNSYISLIRYQRHLIDQHGVTEQEVLQTDTTIEILINESESVDTTQKIKQDFSRSQNICSTCGKVFSSITTCKAHEKTHLDMQYICDMCGSSFKVKAYLTSHVQKVHMKLKRYFLLIEKKIKIIYYKIYLRFKCSMCSAAFVHRELLNYHVK